MSTHTGRPRRTRSTPQRGAPNAVSTTAPSKRRRLSTPALNTSAATSDPSTRPSPSTSSIHITDNTTTSIQPASQRRNSLLTNVNPSPSPAASSSYTPCRQTLFLHDDLKSFSWTPSQSPVKGAVNLARSFHPYASNIHTYFTSRSAAKNAAALKGPISVYRHIGHVVLPKFQQRDNLPAREQWFPSIAAGTKPYVNMAEPISKCWSEDGALIDTLTSLSSKQVAPWKVPYIVLVARRDHVIRACDFDTFKDDYDLEVQVYAGRLLFELIACADICGLFKALVPSVPYTSVATMPDCEQTFARSSGLHPRRGTILQDILRRSESTGYIGLSDAQRSKIDSVLTVKLYTYQEHTVRWMLDKENGPYTLNDFFWEERSFTPTQGHDGGKFYYFPRTGEVRLHRPPRTRGGMVAEEMGLGKTVEALALIAAQREQYEEVEVSVWCEEEPKVRTSAGFIHLPRRQVRNEERYRTDIPDFLHGDELLDVKEELQYPTNVRVRRWPSKTTLIVCPKALLGQWEREVQTRTPSLQMAVWDRPSKDVFPSIAVGKDAVDIVLTTYDMIRRDPTLLKICWRRLIIDEAQVMRRSAAKLWLAIYNLRCDTRFVMTGTPLVNSIDDLKNQLAFLHIWPFTLEEDGFWETYIAYPLRLGIGAPLLRSLLRVTMIRHSKAQSLGINLPTRTYETVKVNFTGSYRACYYYVLASCLDEVESQAGLFVDSRRVRTLVKLLLLLCLSPFLLDVVALDLARRFTWSRHTTSASAIRRQIVQVSAQEAMKFVGEGRPEDGTGEETKSGALGRGSSAEMEEYLRMATSDLREMVVSQGLMTVGRANNCGRDRLAAMLAGGIHRLATDTLAELRRTAMRLGIGSGDEVSKWSRATVISRLRAHYEMENGMQTMRAVHESGFSAIMKLMKQKENPSCPVCLMDCDGRIALTKCGHLYCLECLMMMLDACVGGSVMRCAICRRDLGPEQTVEVLREVDEEKERAERERQEELMSLLEPGRTSRPHMRRRERRSSEGDSGEGVEVSDGDAVGEDGSNAMISWDRPSAREVWAEFERAGCAPASFSAIGRNERFPSLCPEFLRHLAATRSGRSAPPKLEALLNLIESSEVKVKFCVVAGSVESLGVIADFLAEHGIECVGSGAGGSEGCSEGRGSGNGTKGAGADLRVAAEKFATDERKRVYLLHPTSAAGLTLTAARVVVFMEALVRVADEIQAVARVHRIGQTGPVRIVRIVGRNTLEERVVERRGGDVAGAEEEARALAAGMAGSVAASDELILQLFGRGRDDHVDGVYDGAGAS